MQSQKQTSYGRYIQSIFNIVDLLIVNTLFCVLIHMYPGIADEPRTLRELWLLLNISIVPYMVFNYSRRHSRRVIQMDHVLRTSCFEVFTHALFFLSFIAFLGITAIPNRAYLSFYGMMLAALILWQTTSRFFLKKFRRSGYNFTKVVIVGTGDTAVRLHEHMKTDAGFGYKVLGYFDRQIPHGFQGKYLGTIDSLEEFVSKNDVRQIFFTLSGDDDDLPKVVKIADNHVIDFYYVPRISRFVSRRFELHSIGSMPVMSIRRNPLKSIFNRILKRTLDLTFSTVFLCFYPLIYIPVAIAIKMSSPGPVYFRQSRTGYRGQTFQCLKFRTMRVNDSSDKAQATKNDPRKTRIGDILRKTSIDELPQFINVWKGDMSIVGPRPHMLKHTEDYTRLVDKYMVRHVVKPGITGWAQVNGYRGLTDELWKMEKRVEHDVWYIENWTFFLDIKIIIRTVINAVVGEKNAF